jgi:hypothetical protein
MIGLSLGMREVFQRIIDAASADLSFNKKQSCPCLSGVCVPFSALQTINSQRV